MRKVGLGGQGGKLDWVRLFGMSGMPEHFSRLHAYEYIGGVYRAFLAIHFGGPLGKHQQTETYIGAWVNQVELIRKPLTPAQRLALGVSVGNKQRKRREKATTDFLKHHNDVHRIKKQQVKLNWIREMLHAIGVVRGGPSKAFCLSQINDIIDITPIHSELYINLNRWIIQLEETSEQGFRLGMVAVGHLSGDDYISWVNDESR